MTTWNMMECQCWYLTETMLGMGITKRLYTWYMYTYIHDILYSVHHVHHSSLKTRFMHHITCIKDAKLVSNDNSYAVGSSQRTINHPTREMIHDPTPGYGPFSTGLQWDPKRLPNDRSKNKAARHLWATEGRWGPTETLVRCNQT